MNYHYELAQLADNNRAYLVEGAVPAAPAVRALLGAAAEAAAAAGAVAAGSGNGSGSDSDSGSSSDG